MNDKRQKDKKKNQGFSLFTVIVAVSFVGILGMLVVYISMANLQMKVTDLRGKDSFYTAEQALEEIRTGLQQDVGDAMAEAFVEVMEEYDEGSSSTADFSMDDLRKNRFQSKFVSKLHTKLRDTASTTQYDLERLKKYVDPDKSIDDTTETLIVTSKDRTLIKDMASGVVLKKIKVIYVDPKGRASIIVTDIRLGIPDIDFPTPSTLPDLLNLSIVADKGIICEGGTEPAVISGSVYAGRMDDNERKSVELKTGAQLEISKSGERFVSEGDILVNLNGKFSVSSGVDLWAQGISLASATVELSGNTYLADDLTVERNVGTEYNGSNVTISGNYYGYGFPASARESLNYKAAGAETTDGKRLFSNVSVNADLSSAIIINGKNTTMNLSGVHKLMLAGRSYISSKSIPALEAANTNKDVMTGESLTVKGTQIVYLVPPELLGLESKEDEILNNPMKADDYTEYKIKYYLSDIPVKSNTKVAAWGNRTLAQITGSNDRNEQVQEVFYNSTDGTYVYFYLKFATDEMASSFMKEYYSNNPTVKNNLDQYLSFYFDSNSGIKVKDPKSFIRYVTNGNVLSYDGAGMQGDVKNASSAAVSNELINEQINFQDTWYALNRKMLTSVHLLKSAVKDDVTNIVHDESDPLRSVFDNFVRKGKLADFVKGQSDNKREFTHDGGLKAVVVHNGSGNIATYDGTVVAGSGTAYRITAENADGMRLLVCTGNVEIMDGVTYNGIILAGGTITLRPGSKITASSQDTAKVLRAQSDGFSLKDILWDGNSYITGNTGSSSTSGSSGTSGRGSSDNIYDLSKCVTYENWKKQ